LPFKEKKRILEAVVSPATGGKITVRYGTEADYIGEEESFRKISNEEAHKPRPDLDLFIEMQFDMDINRIEAVISSLNNKELLNKVGSEWSAGFVRLETE